MITFDIKKAAPELFLQAINHISENQKCWIVGGFLRDVYWGKNIKDIDLVLDKNVLQNAELLKKEIFKNDCSFEYFENFRTARLIRGDLSIGLSTIRKEKYVNEGQLPFCEFDSVSIYDDLERRDFTINAIATSIDSCQEGVLSTLEGIPISYLKDLENKNWKVFHAGSFIEDPTRLIRLYRYRFLNGGNLDSLTLEALDRKEIKDVAKSVAPERWRNEILKLVKEGIPFLDSSFEEAVLLQDVFQGEWVEGFDSESILSFYSSCRGPDAPFTWARLGARKNEIKAIMPIISPSFPEFNQNWDLSRMDNLIASWSDFLIDLVMNESAKLTTAKLKEYLDLREKIILPNGNELKLIGVKGKRIGHCLSKVRKAIFRGYCEPDKNSILNWVEENA